MLNIESVTLVGKDSKVLISIKVSACADAAGKAGDKVGAWRMLNWNHGAFDSKGMEGWVLSAKAIICKGKEPGDVSILLQYTL